LYLLVKKILRSMANVIRGKGRDEEVAVIISLSLVRKENPFNKGHLHLGIAQPVRCHFLTPSQPPPDSPAEAASACRNCLPYPASNQQVSCQSFPFRPQHKSTYNINQTIKLPLPPLNQLRSIPFLPFLLIFPKIPPKRLLPPRTLPRITYRRKRTHAPIHARILQKKCESTMAAHRMARDADARFVEFREGAVEGFWELGGDVVVHFVVFVVGGLGRV
jgi:hypothetical protein